MPECQIFSTQERFCLTEHMPNMNTQSQNEVNTKLVNTAVHKSSDKHAHTHTYCMPTELD